MFTNACVRMSNVHIAQIWGNSCQYVTYKNNQNAITTFRAGIPNDNIPYVICSHLCHELSLLEVSKVIYI